MAFLQGFSLNHLNPRERLILLVGGGVVFVFAVWGILEFTGWYQSRMQMMERMVREKQQNRLALMQLQQEYSGLKDQFEKIEDRIAQDQDSFSLLSYLESLAGKLGMRSNIAYMRPQPETDLEGFREMGVEVKVQNVTLEQAVRFLSSIDDSPHLIRVKQLRMRTRFSDSRFMDATFLTVTYKEL